MKASHKLRIVRPTAAPTPRPKPAAVVPPPTKTDLARAKRAAAGHAEHAALHEAKAKEATDPEKQALHERLAKTHREAVATHEAVLARGPKAKAS